MALQDIVKKGSTDRSVTVRIIDSADGTPETGVVFNTSGIDLWYRREGEAKTSITEATLAALTTAHADGGFLHVSDGEYRLDLPDAAFATGAQYVDYGGTVTGMVVIGGRVRLVDIDWEVANIPANVIQISGDSTAADNLEAAADGTGYNLGGGSVVAASVTGAVASVTGNVGGSVVGDLGGDVTGNVNGSVASIASGGITAASFAADAITAAKVAADVGTEIATAVWASGTRTLSSFGTLVADTATAVWAETTRLLTAGTNIVLAKGTGVTGFNDLSAAQVNAEADTAIADAALATAANLATVAGYLDTEIAAIKAKTDNLPAAPAATGDIPSAASIADAVWDEAIAGHAAAGSTGEALSDAGAAGTPPTVGEIADAVWDEDLTGHTTTDTAGDILGNVATGTPPTAAAIRAEIDANSTQLAAIVADTNELQGDWVNGGRLDLILDARASQTSVDDLPTNAELATSQAAADDATLAAIAALSIPTAAANASQVRTELTTELGRIDAAVSTRATPAQVATELGTYDAPTKAELDAAVALLATAANLAAAKVVVDAIKVKTDLIPADPAETSDIPSAAAVAAAVLAAAAVAPIDANVQEINDVALTGDGNSTPWGPAA